MRDLSSVTHKARKRFGQNFLQDQIVIHQIIEAICPKESEHLVEIGPGQGALTRPLLDVVNHLDVIEIDRDLVRKLKAQFSVAAGLKIHEGDALRFDFNTLKSDNKLLRLIGNLPYNISSPLIFHLLKFAPLIQDMHFMLQKEVVDRLSARPNEKNYGRLSVMVQYYCSAETVLHVKPQAFDPQPKVDSAVVRLIPHATLPHFCHDRVHFENIVRQAFNQRRKTLRKSLKNVVTPDELTLLKVDPGLRPENLSVEQFVAIANSRYIK